MEELCLLPGSKGADSGRQIMSEIINPTDSRKRYAVVGTGARVSMFIDPLAETYGDRGVLVGLCDISETRRTYHQKRLDSKFGIGLVPTYADFDVMCREQRPDVVIVCTVDALHHEFIVKALDSGCDVITEKPLTTDETKCRAILDAVARTGRSVKVTFNLRWLPAASRVKQLLEEGAIGSIKSVAVDYLLDTSHGADYFRRWHSQKENSGGLLVHKSTHHFDLVNWWVDSIPATVSAFGSLAFYGQDNAIARGETHRTGYERYTGHEGEDDPFRIDLQGDPELKALYLDAENDNGYVRDRNVFREGIDIEDSLAVLVRYRSGAILNYSLTAFSPMEGFRITLNGDKGRIEYATTYAPLEEKSESLKIRPLFGPVRVVDVPELEGSHGGADPLLQRSLFGELPERDALGREAGPEQGAASALIGFAANRSMAEGRTVAVDELLTLDPEVMRLSALT
jgi:predicted dehydrogenase